MPITELPGHTLDHFYAHIRQVEDCLYRIRSFLSAEQWARGDVVYLEEQLERCRRYVFAAKSVCTAQAVAVERTPFEFRPGEGKR